MARKQFNRTTLRDKLQQHNDIKKIFPKMTPPSNPNFYTIRDFIKDASDDLFEEQDTRSMCVISKFLEKKKVNLDSPAPQEWLVAMLNHKADDTMKLYVELVAEALPFLDSAAEKTAWANHHLRRLTERAAVIDAYYEKMSTLISTIGQVVISLGKKLSHLQTASNPISNHRSFWADFFNFLGPESSGADTHTCLTDIEKFYSGFSESHLDDPIHCRWIDVARECYGRDHDTLQLFVDVANEALHYGWSDNDKVQWASLKIHTICAKIGAMMQLPTPPESPRMKMGRSKPGPKLPESTSGRAASLSQFAVATSSTLSPDFGKVDIDFSTVDSGAKPFTFGAGPDQPTTPPRRLAKMKRSRMGFALHNSVADQSLLSQPIFGSCNATTPITEQCATIPSIDLVNQKTTTQTPATPCGLLTLANAAKYQPTLSSDKEHELVMLHVVPLPEPSASKRVPGTRDKQKHEEPKEEILEALGPSCNLKAKEADLVHHEDLVLDPAGAATTPSVQTKASGDHSLQHLATNVSESLQKLDADDHNDLSDLEAHSSLEVTRLTDVMPGHNVLNTENTASHDDKSPESSDQYEFPSMKVIKPSSVYDGANDSQESLSCVKESPTPTLHPRMDFTSEHSGSTRLMMGEPEEDDNVYSPEYPPELTSAQKEVAMASDTSQARDPIVTTAIMKPVEKVTTPVLRVTVEPPVVDLESESEPLFTDNEEEAVLDQSLVSDYLRLSSLSDSFQDPVSRSDAVGDNVGNAIDTESDDEPDDEFVYKPDSLPTLPALEDLEDVFADFLGVKKPVPKMPVPQIPELNLDLPSLEQEYEAALSTLDLSPSKHDAYQGTEKELEKDDQSVTCPRASGAQELENDRNLFNKIANELPNLSAFMGQDDFLRVIIGTIAEELRHTLFSDIPSHFPQSSSAIHVSDASDLSEDTNGLKSCNTNDDSIKDREVIEEAPPDGSNLDELARFHGCDEPHSDSGSKEGLDGLADGDLDNYIRFGDDAKVDDTHGRGAPDEDSTYPSIANTGSGYADDSADEPSHCCATHGIAPLALLDTDEACFHDLASRALSGIVALHAPD